MNRRLRYLYASRLIPIWLCRTLLILAPLTLGIAQNRTVDLSGYSDIRSGLFEHEPVQDTKKELTQQLSPPLKGVIRGALVEKDLISGQIRRMTGSVVVLNTRSPKETAGKFLRLTLRLFGLRKGFSELRLEREVRSLTGTTLTYQRYYADLPVLNDEITVRVQNNNTIVGVNSSLDLITRPVKLLSPRDSATAVEAAAKAVSSASGPADTPVAQAAVMINQNGSPFVVWLVSFKTREPAAAWNVVVDAKTNNIISMTNLAQYQR